MIDGLVALRTRRRDRRAATPSAARRRGVRVATIEGGTDAATVADRCVLVVERRTLPGDPDPAVELARALKPSRPTRVTTIVSRPAMEADADARVARTVLEAAERVTGAPAVRRGDPWWTDAGLIADAGIPVVLVGPAGGGAHADEEWVTTASLRELVDVIGAVILDICSDDRASPPGVRPDRVRTMPRVSDETDAGTPADQPTRIARPASLPAAAARPAASVP